MNELEKFRRNSGQPKSFKIGNDEFTFKPLPVVCYPKLMVLSSQMEKFQDGNFDEQTLKGLFELLDTFVMNSYVDLPKEDRESFVTSNFVSVMQAMMEVSSPNLSSLSDTQKEQIEKLKNRAKEQG